MTNARELRGLGGLCFAVAIACRLAQDVPWRAAVASAIAARLPQSAVADLDRYLRSLAVAYERALARKYGSAH